MHTHTTHSRPPRRGSPRPKIINALKDPRVKIKIITTEDIDNEIKIYEQLMAVNLYQL